jgi:exopolyphosphatase/pppGpp-phosphohydrolase
MLDSPDGEEQLRKERTGIRNRLEKLREEVNQLENNIRFFGNSKNAEALVKPYLEKIERAKNEIKDLEDKQNQLKKIAKQLEGSAKK